MKSLDLAAIGRMERRTLLRAACIAFALEFLVLSVLGWEHHWLAHPQKTGLDPSKFLEAEMYEVPKESHLVEAVKSAPSPRHEQTLAPSPDAGHKLQPTAQPAAAEANQTQSGPPVAANHGPVAVIAPAPVIPSYLQDRDIETSVVIEFFVNTLGNATPRLVSSSGDAELDAIALKAVKEWRFRPAEENHRAIDAKVRLRIQFQVH